MTEGTVSTRERRIGRRLEARGETPLFEALLGLRGTDLGEGLELGAVLAVGGEGGIFTVRDARGRDLPLVAKLATAPWHAPIRLTSKLVRRRRQVIEREAEVLAKAGCPFLPEFRRLARFPNPYLEAARGGEFARPEPCLVMERLPGQDLDAWLCLVHRGRLDRKKLRPTLDRLCVGMLQALADLERRGFLYADLRPGNFRVLGRPTRRARLVDAGGCIPLDTDEGRFPHVPSYLPPRIFRAADLGEPIVPSPALQAEMAGRTLFEVATGQAPKASRYVDVGRLVRAPVSAPVAEAIAALDHGDFPDCRAALATLAERAKKRRKRE